MKKIMSIVLVVSMLAMLLAGCSTTGSTATQAAPKTETAVVEKKDSSGVSSGLQNVKTDIAQDTAEEPTKTGAGVKIGFVSTGTLGDKALTDTTWAGLNKLKEDYPDLEIKIYESPNGSTDWEPNLIAASEYGDLIIVNASSCGDILRKIAAQNPDKCYVANESAIDDMDNVASDVYTCNEIGFLCGILAGMFTQDTTIPGINDDHVVGFVSGMQSPTTTDYFTGFEAGAKYTCPDCIALDAWAGAINDPLIAKELTKGLISQGADVVLGCIGPAVVGVFEACQEAGIYSFGLDTNKDADYVGTNITSALKCGDVMSYNFGKAFIEGTWKPGFNLVSAADGATDITDMSTIKSFLNMPVIDEYYKKACQIRDDLKAGKIDVPYVKAARGEE